MSLFTDLQKVRSEEDVKDAYIRALGLKSFTKGLIDIQTKEVCFEAKNTGRHSCYAMFTQLLHYTQVALNKGEYIPPLLAVIDTEKAAIMRSADVIPFLAQKTIKWGKSASQYTQEALEAVSAYIGTHLVGFKIATDEAEFVSTVNAAIATGEIIRTQITPDNLKQVFDKWVVMIGREIRGVGPEHYDLLFFADIMHDGHSSLNKDLPAALLHMDGAPVFSLGGKNHGLASDAGYRQFWAIYHRPPKPEFRNYLLERRDSLIPTDERSFKGAFYTPLNVVDRAYDLLADVLGRNWQKDYYVWDMCSGVGNLEVKHSNHRRLYMSTLDQSDIDVMKATKTCAAAYRFQYDYLNDDIAEDGSIDYSLTNKLPTALRDAIAARKKILVLINPPYAESGSGMGGPGTGMEAAKSGVASTRMSSVMGNTGFASRELFTQFLVRISRELPGATVAMFSTLKYVNAPFFERFRSVWRAKYLGGFVVHSQAFDGVGGDFPIGFLVWDTDPEVHGFKPIGKISTTVMNRNAEPIGEKTFHSERKSSLLNEWFRRVRPDSRDSIPLANAIAPVAETRNVGSKRWADGAIGSMYCNSCDVQHAGQTSLFSSDYCNAGTFLVTRENLEKTAVIFAVRRVIRRTWLNNRDQFLLPSRTPTKGFMSDCLIWMLFSSGNLTAGADGLKWGGRDWSLVNHFIPFTELEVGAPARFESAFMSEYIGELTLSPEAQAVMDAGKAIWRCYFDGTDDWKVRTEFKLNRPDVGWYQVRNAIKARNVSGNASPIDFKGFEDAYRCLGNKIRPQVYEFGFLRSDLPPIAATAEAVEVILAEAA